MPVLADAFAQAVDTFARRQKFEDALSLLAFCTDHALSHKTLSRAVVDLGGIFCKRGDAGRLPELYAAYPEAKLEPLFVQGIVDTTKSGDLDDAARLFDAGIKTFPESAAHYREPAVALGRAFVERGDVLKPIALHRALGDIEQDTGFVGVLAAAAERAALSDQPEDALHLLEYTRRHFGSEHADAARAAARLFRFHAQAADYERAASVYAAYPNRILAPLLAEAIADAAKDHLTDALALFRQYARDSYPLPEDAVRSVAAALTAMDPADDITEARLEEYRAVSEAYDNPAARATLTLALGDGYIRQGLLAVAESQYRRAGSPEGLLRAACLADEREETDDAAATWQSLLRMADADSPHAVVASYMLGGVTEDTFRGASAVSKLPASLLEYLIGLRQWTRGAKDFAPHFATAKADTPTWFTPLAARVRDAREIQPD